MHGWKASLIRSNSSLEGRESEQGSIADLRVHQLLERIGVNDANMALLDLDDAFFDKLGKGPADGFKLQTQIAADLLACHAQDQFRLREAARVQPLHQVEQVL